MFVTVVAFDHFMNWEVVLISVSNAVVNEEDNRKFVGYGVLGTVRNSPHSYTYEPLQTE